MKNFSKKQPTGSETIMNAFSNQTNELKSKLQGVKMKKIAIYSGIALATVALASNLVLSVDRGMTAVEIEMGGKVALTKHYSEGLHFPVNPFSSFVSISTKDVSIPFVGVDIIRGDAVSNGTWSLQTSDNLTTGVNVEVLMQLKPEFAPYYVQQSTTMKNVIGTYVVPALKESLTSQGSKIASASALFSEDKKIALKTGTLADMKSYLSNPTIMGNLASGLVIKDVKYQSMVLPTRIQEMINQTKERQEAEQVALSAETIRKTEANAKFYEAEKEAQAKEKQADAEAHRMTVIAKANEAQADAKFYSMQKDAAGIKELNSSINPQYIKYMEAQASLVASQNYKGDTPTNLTVMGEGSSAVPFLNVGK